MSKKEDSQSKQLIGNRKAYFNYEILESFEVGIVLTGTEVKVLRDGSGSIEESYISIDERELWLVNSSIPPYKWGSFYNHTEKRKRKLLAHKSEIIHIERALQEKGLSCIPLALYLKKGLVKMKIALGRGKKLHDKREKIKERDEKRHIDRVMKNFNG